MKKSIILVVRNPVGGIRTYLQYVYRNEVFSEYRFCLVVPADAAGDELFEGLNDSSFSFVLSKYSLLSMTFSTLKAAWTNNASLVHSHGFGSSVAAAISGLFYWAPHIMTAHDVFNDNQFSGIKGRAKKYLFTILLNRTTYIQAVGNEAKQNIRDYLPGVDKNKLISINNGICVNEFINVNKRPLHDEIGLPSTTKLFGFLGRFMSQKGFVYLVGAVELLSQQGVTGFCIVCFGKGGFLEQEKRTIEERGLQEYFKFMPFLPKVAETIKGLDVVVIPSLWEAYPLLPLEALVSGVPVIATNCIGLNEAVSGTPSTIIPVKDSLALAEAIKHHIVNDTKPAFEAYKKVARSRYDVNNTAIALEQLYQKIMR